MAMDDLINGINGLLDSAESVLGTSTGAAIGGAVIGSAVTGATIAGVAALPSSSSKRTGKKIKHTSRGWKQDRARRSKQPWEVAYQKRKRKRKQTRKGRKSYTGRRKGLHYTKKGQPYIILASGKARFIKKRKR